MGQPYILNLMNKKNNILSGHFNLSYEILDNLRTAIIILDENLNYFYTNTAAYDLLGSSNILKNLSELQYENVSLFTYIENIKEDEQTIMLRDLKFKSFDRIDRIVDCSISSYYSENDKYILIELNETGRLYNISIDQNLIEQQKATREMVKGLSHEIKNPLGGIMGAAQLLDRTLKDESQTKFTKIIRKESERLLKLINAMSSPIPSNQKELIDIHEITEHVIELFKYDLDNSKILFIKDYDPSIPQLNIDKNPSWDGFEDNLLGYDVKSWDEKLNEIFIEVKASSHSSGIFYLTRNEWNFSLSVKDSFLIHLWIQDKKKPRIISFEELNSKNYKIEDTSNAEWSNIKITPIKIN